MLLTFKIYFISLIINMVKKVKVLVYLIFMIKRLMVKLDDDWMTRGILDMEYKQYELLAYLQKVENKFDELKVYPYFSDLIHHYDGLTKYQKTKQLMNDSFPKVLIDINLRDTTLTYEDLILDSDYILELDKLVDFSLQELKKKITHGKFVYDEVEKCVDILEIGVIHFNSNRGFFIIHDENIDVYEYELGELIQLDGAKGLRTKLIRSYPKGFHLSYETIRTDLVNGSNIKNPSTFIIDNAIKYPIEETLLPITKRLLVKKLSQPKII